MNTPLHKSDQGPLTVHCLVVEDNAFALDIMKLFLEKHGHTVDTAEHGGKAVELYTADPAGYDVIFMDLQMPVMNGYEAVGRIRGSKLAGADRIPIIAMSGEPLHDLPRHGFDGSLRKPFQMLDALSLLELHCRKG